MEDYNILLNIAWPHQRCRLGFEHVPPDSNEDYHTITLDIFIIAIQFNFITYER